jgi:deazaflavin-dependent oxidoreductase (nitroreductase family)
VAWRAHEELYRALLHALAEPHDLRCGMAQNAKDRLLHARGVLHREAFARSGGRLLATWGRLPVVMLTTTGRRSRAPRTTMLVATLCLGDTLVLAASNGGAVRHPDWYLNLSADPEVEVLFRGRRRRMRARTADDDERAELWPRVVAASPAYGRYQERTSRLIPLVLLEPASTPGW